MAIGADSRIMAKKESVYGTRVVPDRAIPGMTAEDFGFEIGRYFSQALGSGRNTRTSVVTTKAGTGSFSGEVPTVGFSWLLDLLHSNTVTPSQVGGTAAYTHTHTLDTPVSKSLSVQVQMPPVTSSTLLPHDLTGVTFGGLTLNCDADGVLTYQFPVVYQNLDTAQTLATYTGPAAYSLFAGINTANTVTVGGSAEANILGPISIEIGQALRQVYYIGSGGTLAQPTEEGKPTYRATWSMDFTANTQIARALNNTSGDVVIKFQHPTAIATTNYPFVQVTLPDCVFTTNRPTVSGPGPVAQQVVAEAASATGDPPVIVVQTSETTL